MEDEAKKIDIDEATDVDQDTEADINEVKVDQNVTSIANQQTPKSEETVTLVGIGKLQGTNQLWKVTIILAIALILVTAAYCYEKCHRRTPNVEY